MSDLPPSSPPPTGTPAPDQNIPMLTDVLHLPRYAGSELPSSLNEVDWADLSLRVQENVMERLMRRSEAMLDSQLNDTLNSVLDRHIHSLQTDLSDSLARLVRDLVARAVGEELSRVHNEISRRKPGTEAGSGR